MYGADVARLEPGKRGRLHHTGVPCLPGTIDAHSEIAPRFRSGGEICAVCTVDFGACACTRSFDNSAN
eukprot:2362247-Rhodomonas_salina.1